MRCKFEFRSYCRPFRQPLQTRHGVWSERQGVIVRLENSAGRLGWGEIAPLEWFGSERLADALAWCCGLPEELGVEEIFAVPEDLPACQFGFEAAWEGIKNGTRSQRDEEKLELDTDAACILLPTGVAGVAAWRSPYSEGSRTFKWKIAVAPLQDELAWFAMLMEGLPGDAKIRLDANGGLSWEVACRWLEVCDRHDNVEFLEQPLPPEQFEAMLKLQERYQTAIALDESVANLRDLEGCYAKGWRGVFVVKAAIAGSPQRLRKFCQQPEVDVVLSSVFETAIARQYLQTHLLPSLRQFTSNQKKRAPGFGISRWFAESALDHPDFDRLWQSLQSSCADSTTIG